MDNTKLTKILVTVVLSVLLILSFSKYLDKQSFEDHDKIFERALITFGIVKALNGAISLVQGTELDLTPAGVGVSLSIGEVLDPINDLIERFSWVMLLSATSLAIQRVIMEIGGWLPVNILLIFASGYFVLQLWVPILQKKGLINVAYKITLLLLVFRFIMPCVAYANSTIYEHFLDEKYKGSTTKLESINSEAQKISQDISENTAEERSQSTGVWDTVKNGYLGIKESLNFKKKVNSLKDKLGEAHRFILDLMAVFIIQTVVIPVVVIWAMLRFITYIFDYNFSCFLENMFCERIIKSDK